MPSTFHRVSLLAVLLVCWLQIACSTLCFAEEAAGRPNLLSNPSFELGRQFWDLGKGGKTAATLDINSDDAPAGGGQSAIISIASVDSWGVQFGQNIDGGKKGKTYTFAAMVKSVAEPVKLSLQIERRAKPWDRAMQSEQTIIKGDQWTDLHVTFTLDKAFPEGWFAYLSCMQAGAKFRVTHFRLYEGEYVPFNKDNQKEIAAAGVSISDSGAHSASRLTAEALSARAGWTALAEDDLTHAFKGDVVLMNNRLALVLRTKSAGAELYSIEAGKTVFRTMIRPASDQPLALASVKILENNPAGSSVEATFDSGAGKPITMACELRIGQPFVQIAASEPAKAIRIDAPSRFAVMPDFFADDIVVDSRLLPFDKAELPSDSFLLNLLRGGDAILMSVWNNRQEEVKVSLSGKDASRQIESADIPCGKNEKVWLAVLSGHGIWHAHDVKASDAGKILAMDWQPPMPALWRVDWRKERQLADSWEMILQRPTNDYVKTRVVGSLDILPESRRRWNTVLGEFPYPCWIAKDGKGYLQPLKDRVLHFEGPAVVYPLGRVSSTPLDAFSVVDIVRATLGVGPCEYILDLEGQQGTYKGRATCANRDTLDPIYEKHEQVEKKAEVEKSLADVIIFIRHIRSRIEAYADFAHGVSQYIADQKKAHPELAESLDELDELAKVVDQRIAARREKIKTPDEAAGMIEAFRQDGMNDTGPNAVQKCKSFTASIVEIGDNQDELSGECRLAVKILRQRAALLEAADPRLAPQVREIRARCQKVLRAPASHESAGH